jgi:hypothetical protein
MTPRARPYLLLCTALFCAAAQAQSPTVAIDLGGLDAAAYRRLEAVDLESRAVLRLVQEGFAVVSPSARPELTIRISATDTEIRLEVGSGPSARSRTVPIGDEARRELHFEVAQKVVDLAREAGPAPLAPSPPPVAAHPPPAAWVSGGMVVRGGQVDPLVQIEVRLPFSERLGVDLAIGMVGSGGTGIAVLEPQLLAGIGYRVSLGKQLFLGASLRAGAALHVYSLDDPTAVDLSGSRIDFLCSAPLSLLWNPNGGLLLGLQLAPGLLSRTREHTRGGLPIWHRDAFRLEISGSAGWHF